MAIPHAIWNLLNKRYRRWHRQERGLLDRISLTVRDRTDLERSVYNAARRILQFPTFIVRRHVARAAATEAALMIPPDQGFRIIPPGRFPEAPEIVAEAHAAVGNLKRLALASTKPFMIGLLREAQLDRESPYLRFALRPDILAGVSVYLRVVPVLTCVDVFYSAWASDDRRAVSSFTATAKMSRRSSCSFSVVRWLPITDRWSS